MAFLFSVLIGAFGGVLLIVLSWNEPLSAEYLLFVLMILFWGTLTSLPYVGAGLALFGLPVTWGLHRHIQKPWFGLVAAGWGGVAGAISYDLFNSLRSGYDELAELAGVQHVGPVYGVPTGLAWWLLYRRVFAKSGANEVPCPPPD
jgi:hypothetical protein